MDEVEELINSDDFKLKVLQTTIDADEKLKQIEEEIPESTGFVPKVDELRQSIATLNKKLFVIFPLIDKWDSLKDEIFVDEAYAVYTFGIIQPLSRLAELSLLEKYYELAQCLNVKEVQEEVDKINELLKDNPEDTEQCFSKSEENPEFLPTKLFAYQAVLDGRKKLEEEQ